MICPQSLPSWTNSMGIETRWHNTQSSRMVLRHPGASVEYSASGSRRERWLGNPVLDWAEIWKKQRIGLVDIWWYHIWWYLMISDDIWWYLLISVDIWWYVDLLWNTNLVHVQTICSAWSHDWTQSCNMTRYDELGKSLDRSQQCPATRMHTFPSAKPLLFLSQFQDEIGATNYSTCERPWLLRTSLTSWCWNLYPRGQGETNLSNSMFLLGNTGMIIQPPRMES